MTGLSMRSRLVSGGVGLALALVAGGAALSFQPSKPAEVTPAQAPAAGPTVEGEWTVEAAMEVGKELYEANCVGCHGAEGVGSARSLANNENLQHVVLIASQVIFGGEFMPKFPLNDEQIAAVGTYIRNSFGNEFGPVTPEEVAIYR